MLTTTVAAYPNPNHPGVGEVCPVHPTPNHPGVGEVCPDPGSRAFGGGQRLGVGDSLFLLLQRKTVLGP